MEYEVMDGEAARIVKAQLDSALSGARSITSVAFGDELFAEFRKRGWITLEIFGWLGSGTFAEKMPAYGGRYAHLTWDIPATEFRVGKDA
jgi:hypothetical protein